MADEERLTRNPFRLNMEVKYHCEHCPELPIWRLWKLDSLMQHLKQTLVPFVFNFLLFL